MDGFLKNTGFQRLLFPCWLLCPIERERNQDKMFNLVSVLAVQGKAQRKTMSQRRGWFNGSPQNHRSLCPSSHFQYCQQSGGFLLKERYCKYRLKTKAIEVSRPSTRKNTMSLVVLNNNSKNNLKELFVILISSPRARWTTKKVPNSMWNGEKRKNIFSFNISISTLLFWKGKKNMFFLFPPQSQTVKLHSVYQVIAK